MSNSKILDFKEFAFRCSVSDLSLHAYSMQSTPPIYGFERFVYSAAITLPVILRGNDKDAEPILREAIT